MYHCSALAFIVGHMETHLRLELPRGLYIWDTTASIAVYTNRHTRETAGVDYVWLALWRERGWF